MSAKKSADALRWLASVDRAGKLKEPAVIEQWAELCQRKPVYVLNRLAGAFEDWERRLSRQEPGISPLTNPLAWLSRKARDEGEMRRLGR